MNKKKQMQIIAVDTTVAMYLIINARNDGIQTRHNKVQELINCEMFQFVLPTPVVAEILAPLEPDTRKIVASYIEQNFETYAFNDDAARISAGVFYTKRQILDKQQETKAMIKYDEQIIGVAINWGFPLCSYDSRQINRYNNLLKRFSENNMSLVDGMIAGEPDYFLGGHFTDMLATVNPTL